MSANCGATLIVDYGYNDVSSFNHCKFMLALFYLSIFKRPYRESSSMKLPHSRLFVEQNSSLLHWLHRREPRWTTFNFDLRCVVLFVSVSLGEVMRFWVFAGAGVSACSAVGVSQYKKQTIDLRSLSNMIQKQQKR
ncbi:hypothetical protein ABG067_007574 [Albugo candida]